MLVCVGEVCSCCCWRRCVSSDTSVSRSGWRQRFKMVSVYCCKKLRVLVVALVLVWASESYRSSLVETAFNRNGNNSSKRLLAADCCLCVFLSVCRPPFREFSAETLINFISWLFWTCTLCVIKTDPVEWAWKKIYSTCRTEGLFRGSVLFHVAKIWSSKHQEAAEISVFDIFVLVPTARCEHPWTLEIVYTSFYGMIHLSYAIVW